MTVYGSERPAFRARNAPKTYRFAAFEGSRLKLAGARNHPKKPFRPQLKYHDDNACRGVLRRNSLALYVLVQYGFLMHKKQVAFPCNDFHVHSVTDIARYNAKTFLNTLSHKQSVFLVQLILTASVASMQGQT